MDGPLKLKPPPEAFDTKWTVLKFDLCELNRLLMNIDCHINTVIWKISRWKWAVVSHTNLTTWKKFTLISKTTKHFYFEIFEQTVWFWLFWPSDNFVRVCLSLDQLYFNSGIPKVNLELFRKNIMYFPRMVFFDQNWPFWLKDPATWIDPNLPFFSKLWLVVISGFKSGF